MARFFKNAGSRIKGGVAALGVVLSAGVAAAQDPTGIAINGHDTMIDPTGLIEQAITTLAPAYMIIISFTLNMTIVGGLVGMIFRIVARRRATS